MPGDPTGTSYSAIRNSGLRLPIRISTVGTSANPGVLIGVTTESILAACDISVLVLKPPGFVSPLARGFQEQGGF